MKSYLTGPQNVILFGHQEQDGHVKTQTHAGRMSWERERQRLEWDMYKPRSTRDYL